MHISLFLGPNVNGPQEDRRAIDLCVEQALKADEAGFSAVYVGEQHFNDYEPYSDPIVFAAYLAGQLKQAYLGTSVIPLPLHHPLLLVERMNLLDQLTRGRCIFGIAVGNPRPMPAFPSIPAPSGRQALFDEKLAVMLRAWEHRVGDQPLEFATSVEHGVMQGRMMPISYRDPHPLFAIGTNTPAKIEDAGRRGYKIHLGPSEPAGGAALAQLYEKALLESGAAPELVEENLRWLIHTKGVFVGETDEAAVEEAGPYVLPLMRMPFVHVPPEQDGMSLLDLLRCDPGPRAAAVGQPESLASWIQRTMIIGSPQTVVNRFQEYSAAGLRHLHARFAIGTLDDVDIYRRSLDLFIDEVMPRLDVEQMPPYLPQSDTNTAS